MPRIPDVTALDKRIPQSRRAITTDRSGEIYAGAAVELGQAMQRVEEKRDRFRYAEAKSELLQSDIQARRELESDEDWETVEKRYRERMAKARDKAAGRIKDRADRSLFDQEAALDLERGSAAIGQMARVKEGDAGRAKLDSLLAGNRAAALNTADAATRTALVDATRDAILGASRPSPTGTTYLTKEQAAETWRKFQESYGEGYAAMLDPEQRVEILSNPVGTPADLIQPDRRAALLKSAQNEGREIRVRRESQAQEDAIFAKGGSLESMRAAARKLDDPEVRDSVIQRLEGRFADREADRNRYDEQNRRAAWAIIDGGGDWEDVPTNIAANMDPRDAITIKDYLAKREAGVKTDAGKWYELVQLAGDKPIEFASLDLLQYRNVLSETDFEGLAKKQGDIKEDVRKGDSIATDNQLVNQALREMKIKTGAKASVNDAERAGRFRMAFERELSTVVRTTGKTATPEDKQKIIDRLMMEVVTDKGFFRDTTARLFEAEDEILEIVVPKDERKSIIAALQRAGKPVNEQNIQQLYLRGKGIEGGQ